MNIYMTFQDNAENYKELEHLIDEIDLIWLDIDVEIDEYSKEIEWFFIQYDGIDLKPKDEKHEEWLERQIYDELEYIL